ncbi:MAG: hypothetical protein AAGH41_04750 [Pseudomonadota bacterium]
MLLTYYLVILCGLALWFVAIRFWQGRVNAEIREGAAIEWDLLQRKDPDLLKGLTQESFTAIFRRVEMPRGPQHVFTAVATFFAGAPFVLALTTILIRFLERTGVIPQPAEQAQQIRLTNDGIQLIAQADLTTLQYILQGWGGFFTFFSLLIFWVIVFFVVFRSFYKRRPGSLREEILRAR